MTQVGRVLLCVLLVVQHSNASSFFKKNRGISGYKKLSESDEESVPVKSDERWDKLVACVKKTHSKKYKSELVKSVTGGGEKTEIALKKKGEKIPTIVRTFNNAEIELSS